MKSYVLQRNLTGPAVHVKDAHGAYGLQNWARDLSETFEWGYNGSGPAALAFSILCDLLKNREHPDIFFAEWLKEDIIARMPREGGIIHESVVRAKLADYHRLASKAVINHVSVD